MIKRVKDVVSDIGSGTTPKSGEPKYYDNAVIPWLNSGDLNNAMVTSTAKSISDKALEDYSALRFSIPFSFILSKRLCCSSHVWSLYR